MFALLVFYFSYQWWFNPGRAVKRQLGEVAAVLSVRRANRTLRGWHDWRGCGRFFLKTSAFALAIAKLPLGTSFLAAVSTFRPPAGGVDVQFVRYEGRDDSETTAHAEARVDVTTFDQRTVSRRRTPRMRR